MHLMRKVALLSLLSLPVGLLASGGAAVAAKATGARTSTVTTSSLGHFAPTFAGSAATGCATNCSLLTGPFNTPSTAAIAAGHRPAIGAKLPPPHAMIPPDPRRPIAAGHLKPKTSFPIPSVSCPGPGCSSVSTSAGGATSRKGLNAVDSARATNPGGDIEPPDQGLCAGNGYVVETNNIGEILIFNTALSRLSAPIPLDTLMGLTGRGWSGGGDPSCIWDPANGGHFIFTEIASATTEASGGPFVGCFAGAPNTCYEGIAVTDGSSPFGPYHVYFANANYNPAEPGYPSLLNDFAKISVTRDAFMMFYDEFPLGSFPGIGGGFFNGAQELAFNKAALEHGLPVTDPSFTVARENMGLIKTPDGTCASDNALHQGGITCWAHVIPAQPVAGQYDNSHGGSGFMFSSLDFYGFAPLPTSGDNRIATWAWTHLSNLNSAGCSTCGKIRFSGQLFSGVDQYFNQGQFGAQKSGPIPLGDQCGAAGLSSLTSCPEGGLATNGSNPTQVSQAQGQLWASGTTEVAQTFTGLNGEIHQGVVYWVVGTNSFDKTGSFSLTKQGYVSAAHENLTMPAMAATPGAGGKAIMLFTLSGNGGPTGADHGGFFPSTAFGRLTSSSSGLLGGTINIAAPGQSPQDGFTEYQGLPGPTRPRWGDYSWGLFVPGTGGRIYFANEYIQFPNCTGSSFTLTIGTCGGTRDGFANWGTSVNYVVP